MHFLKIVIVMANYHVLCNFLPLYRIGVDHLFKKKERKKREPRILTFYVLYIYRSQCRAPQKTGAWWIEMDRGTGYLKQCSLWAVMNVILWSK